MKRSVIVVVLSGTIAACATSPVDAQAGPGWVLWEKNMVATAGSESVTWGPLDGFESIAECRQNGQQTLKGALEYYNSGVGKQLGQVRPDGRSAVFEVTKAGTKQTIDIRYLCFPGQFDPRPHPTAPPAKR